MKTAKYLFSCDSVWGKQGMELEIDNGAENSAYNKPQRPNSWLF